MAVGIAGQALYPYLIRGALQLFGAEVADQRFCLGPGNFNDALIVKDAATYFDTGLIFPWVADIDIATRKVGIFVGVYLDISTYAVADGDVAVPVGIDVGLYGPKTRKALDYS